MEIYKSFVLLFESKIHPLIKKNPDWKRLDGANTGGNRKVFGKFSYKGKTWKINSDTHIDKLKKIYNLFLKDVDPFIEKTTKNNSLSLELKESVGFKHLYIYLNN